MNPIQNLHLHTSYCDGINSAEEIIKTAISKGFNSIGFSGHSYMWYSPSHSMSLEGTEEYKKEIAYLKEKYKGVIDVYLGLELDAYSNVDLSGYDYIIGSLHYLKIGKEYVGFDRSAEVVKGIIDKYFNKNGLEFAKEYYAQLSVLAEYNNIDILGHFDLITKNIEKIKFFDIESKEYLKYAFDALDVLKNKIPFFEVNTGAIARGYRTSPYPMKNLLVKMKELGFGAVITSDCHEAKYLDCAFSDASKLLLDCGFTKRYILTEKGFVDVKL